jgi:magnesium-transporting ATPase (P-type)
MTTLSLKTDLVMNSVYPLTYLLFKHGTYCNRRIHETSKIFLYRTFFLAIILAVFMCIHGFSASMPFKRMMFFMFFLIVHPIQLLMYGITYRNVGYKYLYRIYGEYQRNFLVNLFHRYDVCLMLFYAILDGLVFFLISL